MHINISFLIAIGIISGCIAQSIAISGRVTDTGNTPIAGAVVRLEKGGQADTTGSNGSFMLTSGFTSIGSRTDQARPYMLSATIYNGMVRLNAAEKCALEITVFDLNGKALSIIQQSMDAGTHSLALPRRGAGVHLYKVKSGKNELMIKSHSIGGISGGRVVFSLGLSYNGMAKQPMSAPTINEVIAVTKTGYLNYREVVTNIDTSGIEIKIIVCEDTMTDADGNEYQSVKIGNQVWTVENLRTTKYNDDTFIPLATNSTAWTDLTTPGFCYYNNTANADTINKFGALYNWYAVDTKMLAPGGWHIPTDAEWYTLQDYLVSNGYNWDGTKTDNLIAKSLAAKTDWISSAYAGATGNELTKNNRSGFSALSGGWCSSNGSFDRIGSHGAWWSATEGVASGAYNRSLLFDGDHLGRDEYSQSCGFSVRLVRD